MRITHITQAMQTHVKITVTYCLLLLPLLPHATPFTSSTQSSESTSPVNNAAYTGTHTWLEEWSIESIEDYSVVGYDRKNNMILGFQKSNGKVFSQKQTTAYSAPRPLRLESAFQPRIPWVIPMDGPWGYPHHGA